MALVDAYGVHGVEGYSPDNIPLGAQDSLTTEFGHESRIRFDSHPSSHDTTIVWFPPASVIGRTLLPIWSLAKPSMMIDLAILPTPGGVTIPSVFAGVLMVIV